MPVALDTVPLTLKALPVVLDTLALLADMIAVTFDATMLRPHGSPHLTALMALHGPALVAIGALALMLSCAVMFAAAGMAFMAVARLRIGGDGS
ncbi:hypothetical protein FHR23_002089 [Stakelama sediminis]|uniref:Uncharacterized protein n=1 Tax=Stakelama sediminis TaxID=463200 RepID=A0A840YZB7_9SPHN|nr:hypothetical protein [Stakelama sediminis]MBB5719151.1 hypothetical protein [Stakelama sediminis]